MFNNSVSKPILSYIFPEFEFVKLETIRSCYAVFFHFEYLAYITVVILSRKIVPIQYYLSIIYSKQ